MARFLLELPESDSEGRIIDAMTLAMVLRGTASLNFPDGSIDISQLAAPKSIYDLVNPVVRGSYVDSVKS